MSSRNSATISDSSTGDELRLAATILDECETEGQREEYVKALQKHASVHIYGRCGAPCPGWVTEDCLKYLDQHYKVRMCTNTSSVPENHNLTVIF